MGTPSDPRSKEAVEFLEQVTGEKFSSDFQSSLKSGIILCNFLNALKPNSVPRINNSKMPFKEMENIDAYLKSCTSLGIPSQYLFMTVDLYEGKNLNQVVQNVIALKRQFGYGFERQTAAGGGDVIEKVSKDYNNPDQSTEGGNLIATSSNPTIFDESLSKTLGAGLKAGIQELTSAQLTPECSACNLRITSSFVNACSKSWHLNCFICKRCGTKLASTKYYEEQNKPYCEKCAFIVKPRSTGFTAATKDMGFSFE